MGDKPFLTGGNVFPVAAPQVKSGRWVDGTLQEPMELWQCAIAAEGAAEAALAARR